MPVWPDDRCQDEQLAAELVARPELSGAGREGLAIVLTNVSEQSCSYYGWPGVLLLGADGALLTSRDDKMIGGDGNDTYGVDDAGDQVIETATGGTDLVGATISYALGQNVENLNLNGAAAINGTGNSVANLINGNAAANSIYGLAGDDRLNGLDGNDRLVGGAGNDALRGGGGADTFIFDSALSASTNVDSILDFVAADDTIQLQRSVFAGIAA